MIHRDALSVYGVLFERQEDVDAGEDDAHDEVVVGELDVAGVEEFGEQGTRGCRLVCLLVRMVS